MWYFVALCLIAANAQAQNSTDSAPKKDSESAKVEPKNISALYIGDLLRTKPKDDLEAAGSVHSPSVLNQDLLPAASVHRSSLPYKSHGGHEYSETGYHPLYPESRSTGSDVVKRTGAQAPHVPFNVKGHILTLKPVRLLSADDAPTLRNPEKSHKEAHYPGDDCSKSGDRSYSSEEKPYAPEMYRRAKQTASNSDLEYRSPPSSYYDDDRSESYSSQSDPSTGNYDSKTYPSNTNSKSESSGSYTTSKSTSSSKTMTPNRPKTARIVPIEIANKENYKKNYRPANRDQGFIVYKVKEPSNQKPSGYSENPEKQYAPPDYDREHKPEVQEPHYSQHSSGPRKSRKYTQARPTHYSSSEPKDRPQQYAPSHYEENQGSYEQSSYRPDEDQHYKEQNKPSDNYNGNKYAHQYSESEPENPSYHQSYPASSEEPSYHRVEEKSKPHHSKKQLSTQYDKTSNRGREHSGYRTRGHSTPEYNHPHEQPSRGQKVNPQSNYETYQGQYGHTEAPPSHQSYDRTQPAPRPSEKQQPDQYEYETAPYQPHTKNSGIHSSQKRPYRESSRYARSPEQPSIIVEGRALLPVSGKEQVIMISRESKPYVSTSESFSESDHNARANKKQPKANYRQQEQFQANEGRHANYPNYQTSYKPFNSEYPASYANGPHNNGARKHAPRGYEQPYGHTQSYKAPVYGHSHAGESPQQYQQAQKGLYHQPAKQELYQSAHPGHYQSEQPGPYQSAKPGPYQSAKPGPYQSEKPGPYQSAQQGPYQSEQQGPYQSAQQGPYQAEKQGPYQSEQQGPYQQEDAYDQGDGNEDSYEEGERPVKKTKNHHYISNIEGYKDTYGKDEPLVIDEEFFKKYGISPTAKVIVANAENPNLFVADGTKIKEGEYFGNSGPSSGPSAGHNEGPSSGPSYESNPDSGYGPSSEEDNYDPGYKSDFKEDSYSNSPEELGPPKQLPGSFDDLVDTNPKFLRHLPQLMKNDDSFFKMDSTEASFDDVEFPKVGEKRGYIVSQNPREIVQQHGDGISRIVFNIPQPESRAQTSSPGKVQNEEMEERIVEAATNLIKDIIKSDS